MAKDAPERWMEVAAAVAVVSRGARLSVVVLFGPSWGVGSA